MCHLKVINGDGRDSYIISFNVQYFGISIASGVLRHTEYTHQSPPPVLFEIIIFGLNILHLTGMSFWMIWSFSAILVVRESVLTLESSVVTIVEDLNLPLHMGY